MYTLKHIALSLINGRVTGDLFEGWDFRKGKTKEDLKKAVQKGMDPKKSFGKAEYEIDMVAIYLNDVLKKKRMKKQGNAS